MGPAATLGWWFERSAMWWGGVVLEVAPVPPALAAFVDCGGGGGLDFIESPDTWFIEFVAACARLWAKQVLAAEPDAIDE